MKGRRLEIVTNPETGRPDLNLCRPELPGEYVGPIDGYTGGKPSVFFVLPVDPSHRDAGLRHVCSPAHEFREEPDGSLSIFPSILAIRPTANGTGGGWHGYLEAGVWREV